MQPRPASRTLGELIFAYGGLAVLVGGAVLLFSLAKGRR